MSPIALDVAIVAYRCRELARECLASLRAHPPRRSMNLVVVDNDSRDGTIEMVRDEFPEVDLVEAGRNLGFSAATNIAIGRGSAPYVLALNPDTRMRAGVLDHLLALMDGRPEIGICGCRLEREDGTPDHAARRSFPTPLSALGHFTGLARRLPGSHRLAAYTAPTVDEGPVDAVNGAFMLIRRAALEQVGLFDEGYWMYMEDLDLCYRVKQAGWKVWYEPAVTVVHVKAGTSGRHRRFRLNCAFHHGMARFYRTHYARSRPAALNAAVYAGIAVKFGVSAVRSAVARHILRAS